MSRKLTTDQREQRRERRAEKRAAAAARVEGCRSWRSERIAAAEKARAEAAKKKAKAREEALAAGETPRGVDRVPARTSLQRDPKPSAPVDAFPRFGKHGTPIDSTLGVSVIDGVPVTGNHAYRRQVGARGHERPPRLRTLRAERKREAQVAAALAELEGTKADHDENHGGFLKRRPKAGAR